MHSGKEKQGKRIRRAGCLWLPAAAFLLLIPAWPSLSPAQVEPLTGSSWFIRMDQYKAGAHGSLSCSECHPSLTEINHPNPDKTLKTVLKTDIKRTYDYRLCSRCHKNAHDRSLKGAHAEASEKEKTENKISDTGVAPRCGDCHSAHYVRSHRSRVEVGKAMTQNCGTCHPDQKKSYLENYHGKAAVNLEFDKAAYCTDCHGAHTTRALKEEEIILETCRRCHPDANKGFAEIIIHEDIENMDKKTATKMAALKKVSWLGTGSVIVVTLLLIVFYSHTGLLMLRKLHEKLRRHK